MPNPFQLAALPNGHPSDAIVNLLGVVAVFAFLGIALYIGYQVVKDSGKRKRLPVVPMVAPQESESDNKKKEKKSAEDSIESAIEHFRSVYQKVIEDGREKLEQFAEVATEAFERTADGYATNSVGHEGENHAVRSKKFLLVCDRQWGAFRSDMPYASYLDVQEHLKHILANHRMLNETKHADDEQVDLNPEHLRARELVALMRVVSRDRVRYLQEQMLKAVGVFRNEYVDSLSAWINDQIGALKSEMRPRKGKKFQITDTEYSKKFQSLKKRLEMVARLTEWVTENTQQMNEASLALSQVIHVGTVLRIISCLPEWFEDFELVTHVSEEEGAA